IFNLFNESWSPVRPFYRLVSFESTVVYKPDILPHRFGMSVKLAENYNAVNIITVKNYEQL
ncbi:MAG: hypothetical protein WBL95_06135, partial [Microcoleus sp.]